MKKHLLTISVLVVMLSVVAMTGCSSSPGTISVSGVSTQQEGVWVTGTGEVTVVPDIFNVSLGIVASADTVADAQAAATEAMNDVMQALKDMKIADKDIQTQRFSVRQLTKWERDEIIIIGYEVSNMLGVKVRDTDKAGEVIDAVVAAGGDLTRINSMGFSIDDDSAYRDEAREKAVADAIAKAEQLADASGIKLGNITYISESYYTPVYDTYRGYAETAVPSAAATQISAGETTITATVQVVYAINP
jgi:uncharacterized protein